MGPATTRAWVRGYVHLGPTASGVGLAGHAATCTKTKTKKEKMKEKQKEKEKEKERVHRQVLPPPPATLCYCTRFTNNCCHHPP